MNEITEERFNKIWEDCRNEAYSKGDLFIDDWSAMCGAIGEYSVEIGIDHPDDGDIYTDERHKAFIRGAQWAFKYLKTENVGDIEYRIPFTTYGKKEDWE